MVERSRGLLICAGLAAWSLAVAVTGALASDDPPGGFSPQQSVARMQLPPGFHAEPFASEPDIRQPVAACFDERGRMWVVEYLQYPTPAGVKAVQVDQYLRTEYDRVPEPPPRGVRGADRIKILEDTDGDGRADKVTTFVEGLNLASGVAVGHGGVFVANAPYLLFYPDRDRDDRPDGDPEVLLTGFGIQDAHAVINSLTWGPDGWLYGAQGSTVTAKVRGFEFQQGIWRYHPITREFELFAEGGGNTWGLDFDRLGRVFGSSNGSFVVFHMVQGGYYWKGFAKHGPLHNPRSYGYFNSIDYVGPKVGGHVTPGGIFYKGGQFPAEFDGTFIGGNLLANAVYWHVLEPKGSTVRGRHGGTLIDAKDRWFRPVDLLTGPDGCVYVVDWYDRRASHLDPRDNWDRTNGRIYRVHHGERPRVGAFDLATWSNDDLIALRTSTNDWWPDTARRILAERHDPSVFEPLWRSIQAERDPTRAMRDLWALDLSGGIDETRALVLLNHPLGGVRAWAVRLIGDHRWMARETREELVRLARAEPDPHVRSQLASSAQRWPAAEALEVIAALVDHSEDLHDEHIPLQIWWAVECILRKDPDLVVGDLGVAWQRQRPIVRDVLLERIARALSSDQRFDLVARLLGESLETAARDHILDGLGLGLAGRSLDAVPAPLADTIDALWSDGEPSERLVRVACRLGYAPALRRIEAKVTDPGIPDGRRIELLALTGDLHRPGGQRALMTLLGRPLSPAVQRALIDALASFAEPEAADALIGQHARLDAALKSRVIDHLVSRASWADRLLDAVRDGEIPARDIRTSQLLQIARLNDPDVTAKLRAVIGSPEPGRIAEEKARRIAEVRGVLPEGDKGNAARGRAVFQKTCSGCHTLFGEGQAIGPDLTGVERGDLEFLLSSVVDPSGVIRKEYQPRTVALTDGRVLTGLVVEEYDQTLTLFDANQQRTTVARDQIDEQSDATTSIMPEGLLDNLTEDQIRDLFRYLQSSGP